jgi:PAS domain S-box-containing protein
MSIPAPRAAAGLLPLIESVPSPLRVLVVDDNPGDARLIALLLEGGPYSCATVTTFEDGLEVIRQRAHDAYLIDYRLGDRTGLDLIAEVAAGASGPLILVTGMDDPEVDYLALAAGASDFLSKQRLTSDDVTRSIRYAVETWKARTAAEAEKDRFRELYEGVPMGLGRISTAGLFTDANHCLVELFECGDLQSLIGTRFVDRQHHPGEIESLLLRAERDEPVPFEMQMKRDDGSPVWVGGLVRSIRGPDGEVSAYGAAIADITARRAAEAQVYIQSAILDQVPSGVIATDPAGLITYWNRYAEVMFGWKGHEVIGRHLPEVIEPAGSGGAIDAILTTIAKTGQWSGESEARRKDRSIIPTHLRTSQILDGKGEPVGIVGISTDITERVASERALKESEELFKEVFDGSPVAMCVFEVSGGRLVSVNRAMAESFGYEVEDLLGMTMHDLTHPDDLAEDTALFGRLLAGDFTTYEVERQYTRADATVIWGLLRISLIGPRGDSSGLGLAHILDISRRKAAEAEIVFQTSLLDQVHNAVIATDLGGTVTYWNRHAERLYGWSAEEIMGRNLFEVTVPGLHPGEMAAEAAAGLIAEGKWDGEVVLFRKDGSSFPAWSSDALLRDAADNPIGVVGIKVDLTQQKEAQAESQRLGDLASSVMEALQYPQAVISANGSIVAVNSAWVNLIRDAGIAPEDGGVGASYVAACRRGLGPEGFDRAVVAGIEAVLAGRAERFRHEYTLKKARSVKWFRIDVTPVPGTGAVVAHADVTDERKARGALEDLIRAKDEFIASVSHELRTPLTAVVGLTQELSEGRVKPHEIPELQSLIAQQAQEVSDIVEDLLVAARASADTISIRPNPFNIRKELEVVVRPWVRGGDNAFDLEGVSPELMGRGDAVRVRQILRNLVANSVRYGAPPIAIEARTDGTRVTIAVRDQGAGIPAEAADRMFEPYARLGGMAGLPSSVGLGLYVSRLLARMMDGDLQYRRRDGVTEFVLTLPAERRRTPESTSKGRVSEQSRPLSRGGV